MNTFNELGFTIADMLAPLTLVLTAAIFVAFAWNFTQNFAVWLNLKARGYREREEVYLNGSRAVITKLGFMSTTFLIINGEGLVMRWASVSNNRLDWNKIERISLRLKILENIHESTVDKAPDTKE